jgi:hypothetical protein
MPVRHRAGTNYIGPSYRDERCRNCLGSGWASVPNSGGAAVPIPSIIQTAEIAALRAEVQRLRELVERLAAGACTMTRRAGGEG